MILLDTNPLARMTDSAHPQCAASRRAIQILSARGERLIIVPQILYEFWAVATRAPGPPPSGGNGLGMTCARAGQWIQFFRRRFDLLPDHSALLDTWLTLVKTLGVRGH